MGNEETPTAVNNNEMPIPKIKHDWYQTDSYVVVPVLAKGAKNVKVIYEKSTLSVTALLPSGNEYSLELDLAHPIVTDQCSHKVDPSKIEIKLKKQDGITWTTLEGNPIAQKTVQPIPQEILQAGSQPEKNVATGRKQRDWNKVEKEIEKQEAEEKLVGEAALCALFQQIYGSGSDEVKRAMNKSIQESGGTVLSTNWAEVSKGKVEVKLPDGMEWKPWNT